MRKIFSLLITAICLTALSSCSDDDKQEGASVSFKRPVYILESASTGLEVEIGLTVPATTDITVPFTVSGSAVQNEDFTLSAEQFEIKKGESSATITVYPLNTTVSGKDIKLQLTPVKGYSFGYYNIAVIPVQPRSILTASFDIESYELATETEVSLSLKNGSSKYTKPQTAVMVPFDIDASSTAVLGTHFEIVGGEQVLTMTSKDTAAKVKLRYIKKENGKDKIVLRIHENEQFQAGVNNRATVTIISSNNIDDMAGTWICEGLTNKNQLVQAVESQYPGDADNVPSNCPAGDEIVLSLNGSNALTLDISGISGDLKNYLRSTTLTKKSDAFETLYELEDKPEALVATMEAGKVNVPFSSTTISERNANVGIRMLDNGNTLELRIYEYEPVDFLTRTYAFRKSSVAWGKEPMKQDYTLVYKFTRK